jgi:GNAT superfamily N-acetyltransferase
MDVATPLVQAHVRALFRTDHDGRLLETNEAKPNQAPRVFLARTAEGTTCRVRHDVGADLAAELRRIADRLPPLPEAVGAPETYDAVRDVVAADAPVSHAWYGPAFVFAGPARPLHPEVVEVGEADVFDGEFADFRTDLDQHRPFFAVVRGGSVVAGGFTARLTDREAEAGVQTHPAHRRQGLGVAVVNAWRVATERSGRLALYSTSYDNTGSRGIARALDLDQYAETFSLT